MDNVQCPRSASLHDTLGGKMRRYEMYLLGVVITKNKNRKKDLSRLITSYLKKLLQRWRSARVWDFCLSRLHHLELDRDEDRENYAA